MCVPLLVAACQGKPEAVHGRAGEASPVAPGLLAHTLDGQPFDLAALRGQVVLVNLWATWCPPCREELPALAALHRTFAARGFAVVGVSVDRSGALPAVRAMVERFDLPYPIVVDPTGEATAAWSAAGYPTSFLIDRTGHVRWQRSGIIRPDDKELQPILETLLKEPDSPGQ